MVKILRAAPMDTKCLHRLGQCLILGDDHASITESTQILTGKERETSQVPEGPRWPPVIRVPPNSLGSILNDVKTVRLCHLKDRGHIGTTPKQVDGNNGFCMGGDLLRNSFRLNVKGL